MFHLWAESVVATLRVERYIHTLCSSVYLCVGVVYFWNTLLFFFFPGTAVVQYTPTVKPLALHSTPRYFGIIGEHFRVLIRAASELPSVAFSSRQPSGVRYYRVLRPHLKRAPPANLWRVSGSGDTVRARYVFFARFFFFLLLISVSIESVKL